jgi:hypothetical protein
MLFLSRICEYVNLIQVRSDICPLKANILIFVITIMLMVSLLKSALIKFN